MLSRLFAVAALAALFVPAASKACDPPSCYCYKYVTCYEKVIEYEDRCVCVTKKTICYDECGHSYVVTKNVTEHVKVPVTRYVAVTKRVKVYN
jgi:hypothetical protein